MHELISIILLITYAWCAATAARRANKETSEQRALETERAREAEHQRKMAALNTKRHQASTYIRQTAVRQVASRREARAQQQRIEA